MTKIFSAFLLAALIISNSFAAPKQPNIILILADDMGYGDLSCFGQKNFTTPNIDRLAASGMKLTQHYSGSTVCGPSRAALLSGLHTGHGFLRGNGPFAFPYDPEMPLISYHLKKHGYTTAMIGKSGIACDDYDINRPNKKSFDHFFGYLAHKEAHRHYPKQLYRNGEVVKLQGNEGKRGKVYAEDLIAEEVYEFVENNKDKPFFLHWASGIPHADLACPQEEIDPWIGKLGKEKSSGGGGYAAVKHVKATHVAMITRFDRQVGKLLDQLKELDLDRKTFIFFSSDNGSHFEGGYNPALLNSSGPLRGGKRDLFEGGIRVPTIVSWPSVIKAGTESDHVSAFWDFPATALHIARKKVDFPTDGISYLPALLGKKQKKHEALYWEFNERGGRQAVLFGNGRWKAIRLNVHKNKNAKVLLFDLQNDLGEKKDISAKYPEIVEQAKKYFKSERTQPDNKKFRFNWEK